MTGHYAPNLLLNEEQQMLSATAQNFVRERAPAGRLRTFRDAKDAVGFSRELWHEMAELGWLGLQIPEAYGGLGLGFFDLCVVLEASGRELMPEPFISTVLLGAQALLLAGNDQQKAEWLPKIAAGKAIVSLAFDEHDRASETKATRTGDGFEITGAKTQVLDGHLAEMVIVLAGNGAGQSLFLVDTSARGVTVERQARIDGHNAAILELDRVAVPDAAVLGELGKGTALIEPVFERASVGLAAHMLGASEQAFADTLAYIKERKQFDAPIGSFQALQHRAVDLYTEIALCRSAVLAAARAIDESPEDVARLSALANAYASETFMHVAKEAIQMHGGIGVTDEHDIGFYLKRAQATYMSFGEPALHRRRWAELHGY